MTRWLMAASALALVSTPALADDRGTEFRFGVTAHDLADHVEDGPNYTIEALFETPDFLDFIGSPRQYIYGSFNSNGLTNFGATGFAWDFAVAENISFEFKTGLSYNDGVEDIDPNAPPGDPNRIRLATTRALMGNSILFHNSIGLDMDVSDNWAVGIYYEHISHGQILASGRNQALDNAGVRVSYRFGR
jgi:lipid A 3-O-deacylase